MSQPDLHAAREQALVERIAHRALELYVSGRISTRPTAATWRRIMVAVAE